MADPFLTLSGISKHYPGVRALEQVNLSVAKGEVVGLIGENGAGKSTLMNILGGVTAPTAGTITIDGKELTSLTVAAAIASGIAFVHQELNLFDNLTAAANILIGREPVRGRFLRLIDNKALEAAAEPLLVQLGADFRASSPVSSLSLAQKQIVEIAKALSLKARLVIMDEPTSSLTVAETERLLRVINKLKADNVAIIYISHRLGEVKHIADRVVVLRDGKGVAELGRRDIETDRMIRHMIGRELKTLYRPPAAPAGDPVLEIDNVRTAYRPGVPVALSVRRGEILGIAGLVGSGRTELARTVFGLDPLLSGEVRIEGKKATIGSPKAAIEQGIYLVPEDRKRSGLILPFSIRDNISLAGIRSLARHGVVDRSKVREQAEGQKKKLDIRCPSTATAAGSLSGGNQQKVVLAKWLSMQPRLIIFDEPTRGIDVGAKNEIYRLMRELADEGVGILMISSDMEEVIGVSDRVAVMHEGAIAGFLDRSRLTEENILSLAVGRTASQEAAE